MGTDLTDAEDTRSHVVYRLFGEDGQLHYIGCTSNVSSRMTLHHVRFGGTRTDETYPDRASARAAERAAIGAEAPLLNKQHNPKRFRPVVGGGFVPVEPIHPLTAEMLEQESHVVTEDEKRAALELVAKALGMDGAA